MPAARKETREHHDPTLVVLCPHCGANSHSPTLIANNRFMRVPHSEYVLLGCFCSTCKKYFDVACWEPVPTDTYTAGSYGELDRSLIDHYHNAVSTVVSTSGEMYLFDGALLEIKRSSDANLEFLDEERNPAFKRKLPIIPMEALALARGLRLAAMRSLHGIFKGTIGPLELFFSIDALDGSHQTYRSRLSIHHKGRRPLTELHFRFAVSLCFGLDELDGSPEIASEDLPSTRHLLVPFPSSSAAAREIEDLNPRA
jgi:hypothetical protein